MRMTFAATICAVLFLAWAEHFVRDEVVPTDPFYLQERFFGSLDAVPAVLIGDSHTSQGVTGTPTLLNFALAGESVPQMKAKLERLLAEHPEIEGVVLQASPHMFADYRYDDEGRRDYADLWTGAPRSYLASDRYLRARLGWYLREYRRRGSLTLRGAFTPFGGLLSDIAMGEPTQADYEAIRKRVQSQTMTQPLRGSEHFEIYRTMLSDLEARGVSVCMVEYPVTPAFRAEVDRADPDKAAMRTVLIELAAELGADYHSYREALDDYALYRNADHLNRRGAERLTRMIEDDCF